LGLEFKTPGLLKGVGPFRCDPVRDIKWRGVAKKKGPGEKGILPPLQVCSPMDKMRGLD